MRSGHRLTLPHGRRFLTGASDTRGQACCAWGPPCALQDVPASTRLRPWCLPLAQVVAALNLRCRHASPAAGGTGPQTNTGKHTDTGMRGHVCDETDKARSSWHPWLLVSEGLQSTTEGGQCPQCPRPWRRRPARAHRLVIPPGPGLSWPVSHLGLPAEPQCHQV